MGADEERQQAALDKARAAVGTQLSGIYELDERIGFGGMGEVWRGHNIHTGDNVAIKIVLPELARDQTILALFRKEASILNHLSHDAVVRYHVFTVAPNIGRPYLAMEFVRGESLFDVMRRGPMPAGEARRLCHRLALGLHAVHEAGAVHRDLSPDNVILPQGNVDKAKIIDFGIARSAQAGGETLIGDKFAGKYNYVSPEQVGLHGGEVGRQSDIYSLGLVLVAALRGVPLDMSGSHLEIVEKRRTVPDLSGIDETFRPILTAMLQPHPRDRPASMAVIAALTGGQTVQGTSASLPPQPVYAPWEAAGSRPPSGPPGPRMQDPVFIPHLPPPNLPQQGAEPRPSRLAAQPVSARPFTVAKLAAALAATLAIGIGGGMYLGGWGTPTAISEKPAPALVASKPEPAAPEAEPEAVLPAPEAPPQQAATEAANVQSAQPAAAAAASTSAPAPTAEDPALLNTSSTPTPEPKAAEPAPPQAPQPAPAVEVAPAAAAPAPEPQPAPPLQSAQSEPAPTAESDKPDPGVAATGAEEEDLLARLVSVGVDYSVAESDIRDWVVNIYTPYPAFAAALLNLLKDRPLLKPVYIDVIAGNYEGGPGGSSPGSVEEVDTERLKAAVLKGYNVRHGEGIKSFEQILR